MAKLRVAVVGAGQFGKNHCRVIQESERAELAAVVDVDSARAMEATAHGGEPLTDWRALAGRVDAAVVAAPTSAHEEIACGLLAAGIDVLVEKPLAPDLESADRIIAEAERKGRVLQVGHLERFNPAVIELERRAALPLFFEIHRMNLFSPRSLDVDVVLDLMIHDLDIVLWFMQSRPTPKAPIGTGVSPAYRNGKPLIRDIRAVGIPILSPKVDIANVRVEFSSGCVANFTASRVSTERVRKLRFFQPRQYVSLDYGRRDVFSLSVQPADPKANDVARSVPGFDIALPSGMALVPSRPKVEDEEPLRAELRAFLAAVRSRSVPPITLQDGRAALALALEILGQIGQHAKRAGL